MFRLVAPSDLVSLTLPEARRLVGDADLAAATDPQRRALAWATCLAARHGQLAPFLLLVTPDQPAHPEPPKDAA
jgi:hypothetical protein